MKKRKSTKAKVRNLVRISVILFLSMIISTIFCKKEMATNDKILEATAKDAFVYQSLLLVHNLEPNKPNSYSDIESLDDDSEDFVSDAAIKTGVSQYYIRVNYGANCVNIYKKDDKGNYTKPYKSMICSTGKSTPTSGTYKISYKYRWLKLYGDVYGQYSTRIVKNILFHSVPYNEQSANSLEWDEFDKLGTTASAGCIRLTVQDAKWIYDNITSGTYVEFYSDKDNPGPLGKPTAPKISDNKKCRDWDPTDPDINNPWNGGSGIPSVVYTAPENTSNKKETKTNSNNTTNTNTTEKEHSSNKAPVENTENKDNNSNKENKEDNKKDDTTLNDKETEKTDIPETPKTDNKEEQEKPATEEQTTPTAPSTPTEPDSSSTQTEQQT